MNWTEEQLEELLSRRGKAAKPVKAKARPVKRTPGRMNKLEAAYSEYLDLLLAAGEILAWDFEPEKFRIGHKCFYTPDFRIVLADRTIRFVDVKGFREDDAVVKIKSAAARHQMYEWALVERNQGSWIQEVVPSS